MGSTLETRGDDFPLLRRLVNRGSVKGDNLTPHAQPGVLGDRREVAPNPLSGVHLHRCCPQLSEGAGRPIGGPGVELASMRGRPLFSSGNEAGLAQIPGPYSQHGTISLFTHGDETSFIRAWTLSGPRVRKTFSELWSAPGCYAPKDMQ